jgi:hypothetical protein
VRERKTAHERLFDRFGPQVIFLLGSESVELKQPGRFSPVEEVAVLQYVREAYREAYLDQKDAVQNAAECESERRLTNACSTALDRRSSSSSGVSPF